MLTPNLLDADDTMLERAPASASAGHVLPPVNHKSSLVVGSGPRAALASAQEQAAANESASFNFGRLRSLLPSDNEADATLRKSSSTPAALSKMGLGQAMHPTSPKSRLGGGAGGPMRRVSTFSTPLTARRSSAFMWTMDVHRDFETAVQTLMSRGRDVSGLGPNEVLGLMKYAGAEGLTESSIERHLQKRAALQQKLASMLPPPHTKPRAPAGRMEQPPPIAEAEAPAMAEGDAGLAAAAAANEGASASLAAAMARQQAMQRQMCEQQKAMQLKALGTHSGAPVAAST